MSRAAMDPLVTPFPVEEHRVERLVGLGIGVRSRFAPGQERARGKAGVTLQASPWQ